MYFKLPELFVFVLFLSRKVQQGMRHHFRHAKSLLEYRENQKRLSGRRADQLEWKGKPPCPSPALPRKNAFPAP
jgi:hypothetical protein